MTPVCSRAERSGLSRAVWASMQVSDRAAAAQAGVDRELCGWGRTAGSRARVVAPGSAEEVAEILTPPAREACSPAAPVAATETPRSSAAGGCSTCADWATSSRWTRSAGNPGPGGGELARLLAALADHGLTLPVVPGTRHVTLAGAIASDIHGKNHHCDGGFARYVASMTLCTPSQGIVVLDAEDDSDLFYATLGGMGLTGVIVDATIRATELPAARRARGHRPHGATSRRRSRCSPKPTNTATRWHGSTCLRRAGRYGRAVVSRAGRIGDPQPPMPERPTPAERPGAVLAPARLRIPDAVPEGRARAVGLVRAFNACEVARRAAPGPRTRVTALTPYLFPLDFLGDWNRLYGPAGLFQYQFVIPDGRETELLEAFDAAAQRTRLPRRLQAVRPPLWRAAVLPARRLDTRSRSAGVRPRRRRDS